MDVLDQPYEVRNPSVVSDEVGGETLAINLDSGIYYVVPPEAAPVWRALSTGIPARALIAGRTDVDAAEVESFLARVLDAGLLRPAPVAGEAAAAVEWGGGPLELETHGDLADLLGLDPIHDADDVLAWPQPKSPA